MQFLARKSACIINNGVRQSGNPAAATAALPDLARLSYSLTYMPISDSETVSSTLVTRLF